MMWQETKSKCVQKAPLPQEVMRLEQRSPNSQRTAHRSEKLEENYSMHLAGLPPRYYLPNTS